MTKKLVVISIFLCLNLWPIYEIMAQSAIADSLENELNTKALADTSRVKLICELALNIASDNPDKAINLANEAIEIANKNNYIYELGRAYYIKCLANYYSGRFTEAIEFANKSLEYYSSLNNNALMFDSYNLLAISYGHLGNLDKRLEYLLICNKIAPDNEKKIVSLINLGNTYLSLDEPNKSLEFFFEAQILAKKLNNKNRIALIKLNISDAYRRLKDYEQAIDFAKQSLLLREQLNDMRGIHYSARDLGTILFEIGNYNEASNYFTKAGIYANNINHPEGLAYAEMYLAKINIIKKNYHQALIHINKSKKAIDKTTNNLTKLKVLNTYVELYKAQNNYKKAFEYHLQVTQLNDSIFTEQKSKQIAELQTIYETEKQQQEIEKQQLQIKRQKYFRNSLIVFSLFILSFAILLYNRFKLKKRTNHILDQKNELLEEKNKELKKLSIVASKTGNAVIIFDKTGKIEWFNEAFEKLYNYSFKEFITKKGNHITTNSFNTNINTHFEKCRESKESTVYETEILNKNHKTYIQTNLTPIIDNEGYIEKYVAIDTDITKLKNAEIEILQKSKEILSQNEEILAQKEELETHRNHLEKLVEDRTKDLKIAKEKAEESDRLKSAFLANMSHEIRTPMNAIIGFADLLNDPDLDDETKEELTRHINHNSDTLLKLIDDIIDIAKIESGQLKIRKTDCSLNTILDQIEPIYTEKKLSLKKEHILFNVNKPEKDIPLQTDPLRLQQIIINLVDNAFKFTEKGKIEIEIKKSETSEDEIIIYVKDTGIGLSEEKKEIIFNRFSKIEDDKKKLYRGSGLGLAICKNLVELLGGKLNVESEKDKGSNFYFNVPIHKLVHNK
ncbi:MAG: tetratricopeptide repeat protein [Bacteroidetes bacterium]|nr:tetratricopeptide repeat protein [Bacteroidota bacterium]